MLYSINFVEIPRSTPEPELMRQIALLTLAEVYDNHTPEESDLASFINALGRRTIVVALNERDEREVVSVGALLEYGRGSEHSVVDLVTAPQHREEDLGTDVLNRLEVIATEAGLTELHVRPWPEDVDFYRAHGYQPLSDDGKKLTKILADNVLAITEGQHP